MTRTTKHNGSNSINLEGSVAKSLFMGDILEENLFPYPTVKETEAQTLSMVIESVQKFMGGRFDEYRKFDAKGEQPKEYIESLKELGLFGLIIPEELGGIGLSNSGYSRVLQETSRYDAATSLTIGAHSSIGMKGLLLFGTAEQKNKYLPKLATGEMIAAFCLTEPGSGSDAASIKTNATKNPAGGWTINGEKIWITNGAFAEFFTVFARTDGEQGKISAFIVERAFPGVSNGHKEDKMGIRASATTTVTFNNVSVPKENLLGEEGKGFKVAMAILNNGRTGLGGGCVGAMKECIRLAATQALERKQFGRSISEFELVKEKIAQMTVNCFAAESVVNMVAHYIDSGVSDYSIEAAISKVFASEALWSSANEALQIAAGNGFMKDFAYEKIVRDSRINLIFEGTNEILRLYIGLSGLKDVGEYLKDIGKRAGNIFNDPIKGFGVLSSYVTKRISRLTSLGRDRMASMSPSLQQDAHVYEEYTQRLSKVCDEILRRLGKNIIGNQYVTKRVAEIAMDLFVGLCIVSRVSQMISHKSEQDCKEEILISRMFAEQAKRRMNNNIRRLISNEDQETTALADFIVSKGRYMWDIF